MSGSVLVTSQQGGLISGRLITKWVSNILFSFQPNHVGVIVVNFSPKMLIEKKVDVAK